MSPNFSDYLLVLKLVGVFAGDLTKKMLKDAPIDKVKVYDD